MQDKQESILITCLQSPKYSVPGTRSCEKIIAPMAPPDWAIPIAVDLFWGIKRLTEVLIFEGVTSLIVFLYLFKILRYNQGISHESKVASSSIDQSKKEAK